MSLVTGSNRRAFLKSTSYSLLAVSAWSARPAQSFSNYVASAAPASKYSWPVRPLMQADLRHSLDAKVKLKHVEDSLVIDDMESDRGWTFSPAVQLSYTEERSRACRRSLRIVIEQRDENYIRTSRSKNGSFSGGAALFDYLPAAPVARLKLMPPQDWSEFNRISVWCYVHPCGNPVNSVCMQFICEGAKTLELPLRIQDSGRPWVIVAVPEHRVSEAVEVFGIAAPLPSLEIDDRSAKASKNSGGL